MDIFKNIITSYTKKERGKTSVYMSPLLVYEMHGKLISNV